MNIGVFSNDPGGATGLAWGIFDWRAELGDALRGRMNAGSATVEGSITDQIREIAQLWQAFFRQCVRDARLPPEDVWYVCENFIFTGANYGGDSAVVSTALIWGVEGYRMGAHDQWLADRRGRPRQSYLPPVVLQNAGDAKGFATGARLKEWDCWVVGRDHERSAWQHLAYFLKRYQIQH